MQIKINKKILAYFLIVLFVAAFVYLGYAYGKKVFPFTEEMKYQAVQLSSGDIYYGKLQTFPCCKLTDVYFLQTLPAEEEGGQPEINLAPLNSLFFGPENTMYLQKKQILWWADLAENSQILQVIKGINK